MLPQRKGEKRMKHFGSWVLLLLLAGCQQVASLETQGYNAKNPGKFENPLTLQVGEGETAESCADPVVIHGQAKGDRYWYLYCTTDPLNGSDKKRCGRL